MNEFGKLMADMMEKAEQSGEPRLTLAEIEAEVIRRRAGGWRAAANEPWPGGCAAPGGRAPGRG